MERREKAHRGGVVSIRGSSSLLCGHRAPGAQLSHAHGGPQAHLPGLQETPGRGLAGPGFRLDKVVMLE